MSGKRDRMGQDTTRQAGDFLFSDKGMEDSEYLDMRTRIKSDKMMRLLLYYSVMGKAMKSETALDIKNATQRLLVSQETGTGISGREEAVRVLQQNFPKRVEVEKGWDRDSGPE
jgi:hypothetical protein